MLKFYRLLSFSGRASQPEFWWTSISVAIVFILLYVFLDSMIGHSSTLVLYPPFIWIMASVAVRRMRDRGRSPVWFLALLIPILGPLWVLLEIGLRKGNPGENHYGPDPLNIHSDYLTVK
jgi:uncharacterized membrane protein YhaH (DUF805 family)